MESVIRAAAVYLFVLVILRLAGKRSFAEMTTFDFVLILIIGDSAQQALLGNNYSLTNSFLVIITLVLMDIGFSLWKQRSKKVDTILEGLPLIILENGIPLKERMAKSRVDEQDILASARKLRGVARLDQIQYAVLERDGAISVIPFEMRPRRRRRRRQAG